MFGDAWLSTHLFISRDHLQRGQIVQVFQIKLCCPGHSPGHIPLCLTEFQLTHPHLKPPIIFNVISQGMCKLSSQNKANKQILSYNLGITFLWRTKLVQSGMWLSAWFPHQLISASAPHWSSWIKVELLDRYVKLYLLLINGWAGNRVNTWRN